MSSTILKQKTAIKLVTLQIHYYEHVTLGQQMSPVAASKPMLNKCTYRRTEKNAKGLVIGRPILAKLSMDNEDELLTICIK
jgi:hypothetical protein